MDLYILRHGIAEERDGTVAGDDSQRRLTAEGKKKMRRITVMYVFVGLKLKSS